MSREARDVAALLERRGRPVVITRNTAAAYDPLTDIQSGGATASHSATAAITSYADRYIDGTRIRAGDRRAIVAALGLAITPEPGDRLIDGGKTWEVVHVAEKRSGPTALAYVCQLRGA